MKNMVSKEKKYKVADPDTFIIPWSTRTYSTLHLLLHCDPQWSGSNQTVARVHQTTCYILLHQLLDQMLNENIAKAFDVRLDNIEELRNSHKGNPSPSSHAATLMAETLSDRTEKVSKYVDLFDLNLSHQMIEKLNKFLNFRDFLYHADVVRFRAGQTPQLVRDFIIEFAPETLNFPNKTWFDTVCEPTVIRKTVAWIRTLSCSLETPTLGSKCSFNCFINNSYEYGENFVKLIKKRGTFFFDDFGDLLGDDRLKFEKILKSFLQERNLKLVPDG